MHDDIYLWENIIGSTSLTVVSIKKNWVQFLVWKPWLIYKCFYACMHSSLLITCSLRTPADICNSWFPVRVENGQDREEHAVYYDSHVVEIQRRLHDMKGCRCLFTIRYDIDGAEVRCTFLQLPLWTYIRANFCWLSVPSQRSSSGKHSLGKAVSQTNRIGFLLSVTSVKTNADGRVLS